MAALNFPSSPTNNQKWIDPNGQPWVYESATNSWTAEGAPVPGMVYRGGLDVTAAAPTGAQRGWVFTVTSGGTPHASFTGLTGNIPAQTQIIFDGANWQTQSPPGIWSRTGTTLSPAFAGDDVTTTGDVSAANVVATGDVQMASLNSGPLAGFRNQIINGDFRIWQRGTSGTFDGAGNLAYYAPDRWKAGGTASATVNRFGVGDLGPKFPFAYGVAMSAAGQYQQNIELTATGRAGSFQKGSVWTLSFWTRNALSEASIKHARFAANATTAGSNWSTTALEEIDTVDIWRRLSTTITCNQDVGASDVMVNLAIAFNASSTLTGVQLEPGLVATPFEHRPIGAELALCQRYYQKHVSASDGLSLGFGGYGGAAGIEHYCPIVFAQTMRAAPTVTSTASFSNGCSGWAQAGGSSPSGFVFYTDANDVGQWNIYVDYTADAEL